MTSLDVTSTTIDAMHAHRRTAPDDRALAHVATGPLPARPVGPHGGRPIYIVVGMHRSGTSLLAHILHYLGIDMADGTAAVSPSNPGGFWERPEIVTLHDEILALIDRPLDHHGHALPFPPGWWRLPKVQAVKAKLCAFVEKELTRTRGRWGFKDPRTSRLLPLWREICNELGLSPCFIWAIRSPGEAGASMALKNPKSRPLGDEFGCLLWFVYNLDILLHCGHSAMAVVDYPAWFHAPTETANDLMRRLGLEWHGSAAGLEECLRSLIRPAYRHHDEARQRNCDLRQLYAIYDDLKKFSDTGRLPDRLADEWPYLEFSLHLQALLQKPLRELDERRASTADAMARASCLEQEKAEREQHVAGLEERVGRQKAEIVRLAKERDTVLGDMARVRDAFVQEQEARKAAALEQANERQRLADADERTEQALVALHAERAARAEDLAELAVLRDRIVSIETERDQATERIGIAQTHLEATIAERHLIQCELADSRDRLEELRADRDTLAQEAVDTRVRLIELEALAGELAAAHESARRFSGEIEQLRAEATAVRQSLNQSEKNRHAQKTKLAELEGAESATRRQLADAQADGIRLQSDLAKAEAEATAREAALTEYDGRLAGLAAELDAARKVIATVADERDTLRQAAAALEQANERTNGEQAVFLSQLADARAGMVRLRGVLARADAEVAIQEGALGDRDHPLSVFAGELDAVRETVAIVIDERDALRQSMAVLERANGEQTAMIGQLTDDQLRLVTAVTQAEVTASDLSETLEHQVVEVAGLQAALAALTAERNGLVQALREADDRRSADAKAIAEAQRQSAEDLAGTVAVLEAEIAKLRDDASAMTAERDTLAKTGEGHRRTAKAVSKKMTSMEAETTALRGKMEQADKDLARQGEEITQLRVAADGYLARIDWLRAFLDKQSTAGCPPAGHHDGVSLQLADDTEDAPADETVPAHEFDEEDYRRRYPDVVVAVEGGRFASGHEHWIRHGRGEGRMAQRLAIAGNGQSIG